jgi:hypothetical protein
MSDAANYRPEPLDSSGVQLTEELTQLIERLAKNAHEVWAVDRMDAGWSYGPRRDDSEQLHPCLIPYEKLSEVDKDIDRDIVTETLRAILALGYELKRKP